MKTRSPQITGHDKPSPGIGAFHFGSVHFSGVRAPWATPLACQPRNCGQWMLVFCASAFVVAERKANAVTRRSVFMGGVLAKTGKCKVKNLKCRIQNVARAALSRKRHGRAALQNASRVL